MVRNLANYPHRPRTAKRTICTLRRHIRHVSSIHPHTRVNEQSVLIPFEDLRAARASLPEFYGLKAEDPIKFLENVESILTQARIHPSGWTKAVEPQLQGAAGTWWTSIKVLDLTWTEFRTELLESFDNPEIQAQLRAEILSTRQTTAESLSEFVLSKQKLGRRINTSLTESQLASRHNLRTRTR
jgi:hypothetical protein